MLHAAQCFMVLLFFVTVLVLVLSLSGWMLLTAIAHTAVLPIVNLALLLKLVLALILKMWPWDVVSVT